MAVERIEEYKQQNGVDILKVYCKSTKNFPEGKNYFYAPAEAIDLVKENNWYLIKTSALCQARVSAHSLVYKNDSLHFHQELCYFYNGFYAAMIDHRNLIEIDNIDENLNVVSNSQNTYNQMSKGYVIVKGSGDTKYFDTRLGFTFNNKHYELKINSIPEDILTSLGISRKNKRTEDKAILARRYLETETLKLILTKGYYIFDFLECRLGDEDILDLERTGKISEEEATYRHIMKYADNAWYYLRYGLQEYFKDNHIPVPEYSLDEQGFMIHPITGQKLCPFLK